MTKTAIIILAAGSSSRLGRPKQLLDFSGKTLLTHVLLQALGVKNTSVTVVSGSSAERIEAEVAHHNATTIYNPNWEMGMGTSVAAGLKQALKSNPQLEKAIFAVCDQPFVNAVFFERLIAESEKSSKNIIASAYAGTLGTPVLFRRRYFETLLRLDGPTGARTIVDQNREDVQAVAFQKGHIDIDTPTDYDNLIQDHDQRTGS